MKRFIVMFLALQWGLHADQESLDQYIIRNGDQVTEGHMMPGSEKEQFFIRLFKDHPKIKQIAETGFNAGHSSVCFLTYQKNSFVTSFDIMYWSYAFLGKKYIDERFPHRHTLIQGDSLVQVDGYRKKHPDTIFDLILIDGGHTYDVAKGDILNFRKLSDSRTLLIVDDLQYPEVLQAWNEVVQDGYIKPVQYFEEGHLKWGVARYVHKRH